MFLLDAAETTPEFPGQVHPINKKRHVESHFLPLLLILEQVRLRIPRHIRLGKSFSHFGLFPFGPGIVLLDVEEEVGEDCFELYLGKVTDEEPARKIEKLYYPTNITNPLQQSIRLA